MSKMVHVAARQLHAGVGEKAVVVEAGTEVTAAVRKQLGLKAADVDELIAGGSIVEQHVRAAEGAAAEPVIQIVSDIEKLSEAELAAVLTVREVPIPADATHADLVALILG